MLKKQSLLIFLFVFVTLCWGFGAVRPDSRSLHKLHPDFHALVVSQDPGASIQTLSLKSVGARSNGDVIRYDAIVYTQDHEQLLDLGVQVYSKFDHFVTVHATAKQLGQMAQSKSVHYVDAGDLQFPMNDLATALSGADLAHAGFVNQTAYTGENVLVCIIDTGIDWSHLDFRETTDTGQSRILAIWDQTLTPLPGESSPVETGAGYGVEYTRAHIEDEIDGSPAGFVREKDNHGHGTHIAGTIAGNGNEIYKGIAYNAEFIIVKAGDGSFLETDVVNALSYARQKAEALGRPIVVNMSLGSDAGPHDGTSAKSAAIDAFTGSGNSRVVVVSAGNSGGENIHTAGTLGAGGFKDITFTVPAYTAQSGVNNDDFDFELWIDGTAAITVTMTSPNGESHVQTANGSMANHTEDGSIYTYNYVSGVNGDRQIRISVYDGLAAFPPVSGVWTLRVTNTSGSSASFHGWLFDRSIEEQKVIMSGGNAEYTLGNSAASAIIVGSYVSKWRWFSHSGSGVNYLGTEYSDKLSQFSSLGPTRDARQKPDLTAPGQAIGSSLSKDADVFTSQILPGGKHAINQGTSMSAPVVTGAAALLLELNASASAADIQGWLVQNARTDSYTGSVWNASWGYGKLDVYKSLKKAVNASSDADRSICVYDQWNNNFGYSLDAAVEAGVRFTPPMDSEITGLLIHTSGNVSVTDSVQITIWSDQGGDPDQQLGAVTFWPGSDIKPYSWNYIPMHDHGQPLNSGGNYHVVISHNSTGNTLGLLMENGLVSFRSQLKPAADWLTHSYDFRIRPILRKRSDVLVAARAFLEGPYDTTTDLMRTVLQEGGHIPTTSPYSEDPRTVAAIPSGIVDWTLLQLRPTPAGAPTLSKSLFLREDGRLVDIDGSTLNIPLDVAGGAYYLVLKHRNHLGLMSADAQVLSDAMPGVFDFSTNLSNLYGGSAVELESGVYGMFAGDGNGDGQIFMDDKNDVWWVQFGRSGYWNGDANLDAQVLMNDKNDFWWINFGTGTQIPD